jgi:hypothetical protein
MSNTPSNDYILLNDDFDPDRNFYYDLSLTSNSYNANQALSHLKTASFSDFSILTLNIRSMRKNFEDFLLLWHELNFEFKVISLTETWLQACDIENSNLQLPGYKVLHQPRKEGIGGGVCIFVHESLNFKIRTDVNINKIFCESLTIEILNDQKLNHVVTVVI